MGALWESLGSTKDGSGANFEGNPGLILTISFFTFFDLWKVPRRSLERVQAQRRRTGGAQDSRSFFFGGPKGSPLWKGHHWPGPGRTKTYQDGSEQGSEVPGEEQRSKISQRTIHGQDLARPGPLARRILLFNAIIYLSVKLRVGGGVPTTSVICVMFSKKMLDCLFIYLFIYLSISLS